jgi:hypothetical protein
MVGTMAGTMKRMNAQFPGLSYIILKTHFWRPWRECSMSVSLHHLVTMLHNNIAQPQLMVVCWTVVDSMGEVLVGIVLTHVCSVVFKMLPPKEKFSERVRNN